MPAGASYFDLLPGNSIVREFEFLIIVLASLQAKP